MQVETRLIQCALNDDDDDDDDGLQPWNIESELKVWKRLLQKKYRDRTWIGVLMMVFQREVYPTIRPKSILSNSVTQSGVESMLSFTTAPLLRKVSGFREIGWFCWYQVVSGSSSS